MRLKTRIAATLLALISLLVGVAAANGQIVGNTLSLSTASASAGESAVVILGVSNEHAIAGIQAEIFFDAEVAVFNSLFVVGRGSGMTAEGRVVAAGHLRVVLYFADSSSLPSDEGDLAELFFTMQGATDDATTLVFQDIILSDPDGGLLTGTGTSGELTVLAPESPPALTIAVLKNPGRTRIVRIMVTVTGGSGNLPTVNADTTPVVMHALGAGVFEGQFFAPESARSLVVSSSDTNSQGTGNAQVTLALP